MSMVPYSLRVGLDELLEVPASSFPRHAPCSCLLAFLRDDVMIFDFLHVSSRSSSAEECFSHLLSCLWRRMLGDAARGA
jgi:hypothetical protein